MRDPEAIQLNAIFYDRQAGTYDHMLMGGWVGYESGLLGPMLGGLAVHSMLDLGAGTGHTIEAVHHHLQPKEIVAVDASPGMLDRLRRKYPAVQTVHNDVASYLQEEGPQFDLITSFGAFEFVPDLLKGLAVLGRRLRPSGRAIFTYEPHSASVLGKEQPAQLVHLDGSLPYMTYRYEREAVLDTLRGQGLEVGVEHIPNVYRRGRKRVQYDLVEAVQPG